MVLDYNSRLKPYDNKGLCGDTEYLESSRDLVDKVHQLADLIRHSNYCVVFTGAGISTSVGIPDFRGPNGVWTRELSGEDIPEEEKTSTTFDQAQPSYTHHALASLLDQGHVKHIISQNVDCLHLRSGIPESKLSELHGNIFMEICEKCQARYVREHDVGGMGFNYTGNKCDKAICKGKLRDFAVDWDTALPEDIFAKANEEMKKADLVLCLGTSLRIRPAGNMPLMVLKKCKTRVEPGKIVIVNLQKTHIDKKASLKIHYYCDEVMRLLCADLAVPLPEGIDILLSQPHSYPISTEEAIITPYFTEESAHDAPKKKKARK